MQHSSRPNRDRRARNGWYVGRIGRLGFLFGLLYAACIFLAYAGLMFTVTLVMGMLSFFPTDVALAVFSDIDTFLTALTKALFVVAAAGLAIRRLHDVEFSAWVLLLMFIPLINLALIGCLLLAPSKEPNKYGPRLKSLRFWDVLGFK